MSQIEGLRISLVYDLVQEHTGEDDNLSLLVLVCWGDRHFG